MADGERWLTKTQSANKRAKHERHQERERPYLQGGESNKDFSLGREKGAVARGDEDTALRSDRNSATLVKA